MDIKRRNTHAESNLRPPIQRIRQKPCDFRISKRNMSLREVEFRKCIRAAIQRLFLILSQHVDTLAEGGNLFIDSFGLFQARPK